MQPKHIIAIAVCALTLAGCNRETTDRGGMSQEPVTGTRRDTNSPPTTTAPATPSATAPNARTESPPAADTTTRNTEQPTATTKPADNTGRNVRDRSDTAVTPGDQSEAKSDVEVTRQIRQALTQADQLSTAAKNIKIITANGKVTLRGPVNSAAEQQEILDKVKGVQGVSSVDNQLEVKNNP